MMKTIICTLFVAILLIGNACKNESPASPSTEQDLKELREQLEAKKNELSDKKKIAELEEELNQVDQQLKQFDRPSATTSETTSQTTPKAAPPAGPTGKVVGSNVTMRSGASVQFERLGNFKNGEQVSILESRNVNNENEAILVKPITLSTDGSNGATSSFVLPKGKAVVIENYNSDNNQYRVSFQHPQNGKMYTDISGDAIETITFSTWYRVRRSNGQEGWMFGKFLKTN